MPYPSSPAPTLLQTVQETQALSRLLVRDSQELIV